MSEAVFALLRAIEWFDEPPAALPAHIASWLWETGSMTRRLEAHCSRLTVVPCRERFAAAGELGAEYEQLPHAGRYWLREVVLYGDGRPWLAGRTVAPQATVAASGAALTEIGDMPLGRYLFQQDTLARDYIHIGLSRGLWARRSRLRLADCPLLLTELFLPDSPVYFQAGDI